MNNEQKQEIIQTLTSELQGMNLAGLNNNSLLDTFAKQILDSVRRINWVYTYRERTISESVCDPQDLSFDPIKAAIYYHRAGNFDEACWLIFLSTHCGKHKTKGWHMLSQLYQRQNGVWSWPAITHSPNDFDTWYRSVQPNLTRAFGNHRKFETLKPDSRRGTNNVIKSYIDWVKPPYDHHAFFNSLDSDETNPTKKFDTIYQSMGQVISFGRTGIFDYLCMIGKVGLLEIEPGSIYIKDATGPKNGAIKLFRLTNNRNSILEEKVKTLNENLSLEKMGFQVLEDAICNWQKSPNKYIHFSG